MTGDLWMGRDRLGISLLVILTLTSILPSATSAEEARTWLTTIAPAPIDTARLRKIEQRTLPACLEEGPASYSNLADYYWAENRELQQRFERLRLIFESEADRPCHALTLVAGAAGIGKTFFKKEVFRADYSPEVVHKFDIRELYNEWHKDGTVVMNHDLSSGDIVMNSLPALADRSQTRLTEYLKSKDAVFYVIDSLDEIHPNDYASVLKQVEQFVFRSDRPFVHVVVFARSLAFLDYWQERQQGGSQNSKEVSLHILRPPRFRTTGDLLVSSWNYHRFRYKLAWSPYGAAAEPMPLETYRRWAAAGFLYGGPFATVHCEPNENMRQDVNLTLTDWAKRHRIIGSMLYNLAGNSILREIVERDVLEGRPYDERQVMEAYFHALLERDTKSDNRPSTASPKHLDLYLQLLESTAARYLVEGRVDDHGFFDVRPDDKIEVIHDGRSLEFPVRSILHRSGIKHIDLLAAGGPRCCFEPRWFHRLLVEMHNERLGKSSPEDIATRN